MNDILGPGRTPFNAGREPMLPTGGHNGLNAAGLRILERLLPIGRSCVEHRSNVGAWSLARLLSPLKARKPQKAARKAGRGRGVWTLLKTAATTWKDDRAPKMAAALAYYTAFAVAPLLIIAIAVAGL